MPIIIEWDFFRKDANESKIDCDVHLFSVIFSYILLQSLQTQAFLRIDMRENEQKMHRQPKNSYLCIF